MVGSVFVIKKEDDKELKLSWMEKEETEKAIATIRDVLNAIAIESVSIKRIKGLKGYGLTISRP